MPYERVQGQDLVFCLKVGTGCLCEQSFCQFWGNPLLCSRSCFKIASDRAKWSNYVHSHISGTQGVNTITFCASTEVLVSGGPDLQIRGGGGGRAGHPDPEIRGGGGSPWSHSLDPPLRHCWLPGTKCGQPLSCPVNLRLMHPFMALLTCFLFNATR